MDAVHLAALVDYDLDDNGSRDPHAVRILLASWLLLMNEERVCSLGTELDPMGKGSHHLRWRVSQKNGNKEELSKPDEHAVALPNTV